MCVYIYTYIYLYMCVFGSGRRILPRWHSWLRVVEGNFKLYSACLERSQLPVQWKPGRLVLLRKAGRRADSPSAYWPIVLLDKVGKLFEWIVAARLVRHLCEEGPDLTECQSGFGMGAAQLRRFRE